MKPLLKCIFALSAVFVLCCVLSCTASADTYDMTTSYNDINANGNTYGADIGYMISGSSSNKTAVAYITACYSGQPVDIPETVTYTDPDTSETSVCRITALNYAIENSYSGLTFLPDISLLDSTLTVPSDLRTIGGNLFNWTPSTSRNPNSEDYHKGSSTQTIAVPNTQALLAGIPRCISEHYNSDGTYYAGKCLVRVDPGYQGDVTVRDGTVCILASAFEGCTGIGRVTLPSSVEYIGMRAFANSSVTSVNIPSGLTSHNNKIEMMTFYGCTELTSVTFDAGASLDEVGMCAFMDCTKLQEFDFSKVSFLDYMCFAGAFDPNANVSVTLRPEQLGIDSKTCAQFCRSGLKGVTFADNTVYPNNSSYYQIPFCCFYKCANLDTLVLGSSVSRIYAYCFEGCAFTADVLGSEDCAVGFLSYRCFAKVPMTEVTIPATMYNMQGGVFAQNPALTTVNYYPTHPVGENSLPMFALLNDCYSIGSGNCMSYFNMSFSSSYTSKPAAGTNTFVKELNIYGAYSAGGTYLANQPYLETVNFHNPANSSFSVGSYNFQFCTSLSTVTFDHPEKVTSIDAYAFLACPSLNSFPFTSMTGLQSIGTNAFLLHNSPNSYSKEDTRSWSSGSTPDPILGYGLRGELDLSNCTALTTLNTGCFMGNVNITSVKLPQNAYLVHDVFNGCISLKEVTADCSLNNLGYCFHNNFSIKYDHSASYVDYKGNSLTGDYPPFNDVIEKVTINNPGSIDTASGTTATPFTRMVGLKTVTIKNAETIPCNMFNQCIALETVNLPDTKTLGTTYGVFYGCNDFTLNAPKVTKLSGNALMCCGIKEIYLPELTEYTVSEMPFFGCDDLETINLPKLETVNTYFLSDFTGTSYSKLKTLNLPSLKTVGDRAFFFFPMESISLPAAQTIGNYAFFRSAKLKTVSLPSVKTFKSDVATTFSGQGGCTFADCPVLETVEFGGELTNLPRYGFMNSGIKSVNIPAVADIDEFAFLNCNNLTTVTADEGLTDLGWFMFCGCDNLSSVTLPETLENVSWAAFKDCPKLKSIRIPASVQTIDDDAFAMYVKKRQGRFNIEFAGAPEIKTSLTLDELTERGRYIYLKSETGDTKYDTIVSLLPIPDGTVTKCATPDSLINAKAYKRDHAPNLVLTDFFVTAAPAENGTVSVDKYLVRAGDTVNIDVEPNDGFRVGKVKYNDTIILPVDGVYSFPMIADDAVVSAEFESDDDTSVRLAGHSLILGDNIGVNFYMELDDSVLLDEDAYVIFDLPDGTTKKVFVYEQGEDDAHAIQDSTLYPGKTFYIFPCEVAAKDMTKTISLQAYVNGQPAGNSYNYTVKEYAHYIIAHPDVYGEQAVDLVKSMLYYGGEAQELFIEDVTEDELASSGLKYYTPLDLPSRFEECDLAQVKTEGLTLTNVSLILESETSLRLYFSSALSELPVLIDSEGGVYEAHAKGREYYYDITGFAAGTVFSTRRVMFAQSAQAQFDDSAAFDVNIGNYANWAVGQSGNEKLSDTIRALYSYDEYAKAYSDPDYIPGADDDESPIFPM